MFPLVLTDLRAETGYGISPDPDLSTAAEMGSELMWRWWKALNLCLCFRWECPRVGWRVGGTGLNQRGGCLVWRCVCACVRLRARTPYKSLTVLHVHLCAHLPPTITSADIKCNVCVGVFIVHVLLFMFSLSLSLSLSYWGEVWSPEH